IEKAVYDEVERVKSEPVADWELSKARLQFRRARAQQLQSTLTRAIVLGQYAVYYREPQLINTIESEIGSVAKEDVQRVARRYLTAANRTIVATVPRPKTAAPAAGSGK